MELLKDRYKLEKREIDLKTIETADVSKPRERVQSASENPFL
jgi:hypothetical protein